MMGVFNPGVAAILIFFIGGCIAEFIHQIKKDKKEKKNVN